MELRMTTAFAIGACLLGVGGAEAYRLIHSRPAPSSPRSTTFVTMSGARLASFFSGLTPDPIRFESKIQNSPQPEARGCLPAKRTFVSGIVALFNPSSVHAQTGCTPTTCNGTHAYQRPILVRAQDARAAKGITLLLRM